MAIIMTATEEDIPRILELYRQLALTPGEADSEANCPPDNYRQAFDEISSFPGLELLAAEDGGEVVGSLVLVIVPNLSHGARLWAVIENVIVAGKHRRCGIGRQLMEYAINRARDAYCCRISLDSNKVRREAHQFYLSLGFDTSAYSFRGYF